MEVDQAQNLCCGFGLAYAAVIRDTVGCCFTFVLSFVYLVIKFTFTVRRLLPPSSLRL